MLGMRERGLQGVFCLCCQLVFDVCSVFCVIIENVHLVCLVISER